MNTMLAGMTPGFADPVHGAQRTFRLLLDAMSRPGSIATLPPEALAGIESPPALDAGAAATLLALLDAETTVALAGACDDVAATAYLRFHSGARVVGGVEDATFTLVAAHALDASIWSRLPCGSDEAPQDGITLVVAVDDFDGPGATSLVLRGPGIASETRLAIAGVSAAFWDWRIALQSRLPCGIDLIFVCGARIACIPRSTRVQVDEARSH